MFQLIITDLLFSILRRIPSDKSREGLPRNSFVILQQTKNCPYRWDFIYFQLCGFRVLVHLVKTFNWCLLMNISLLAIRTASAVWVGWSCSVRKLITAKIINSEKFIINKEKRKYDWSPARQNLGELRGIFVKRLCCTDVEELGKCSRVDLGKGI